VAFVSLGASLHCSTYLDLVDHYFIACSRFADALKTLNRSTKDREWGTFKRASADCDQCLLECTRMRDAVLRHSAEHDCDNNNHQSLSLANCRKP
jgi:hypothetical protein